tara:strand:+ start:402 stop:662 length:261 start_codon:yes stop_codon:yes gene_type:complete
MAQRTDFPIKKGTLAPKKRDTLKFTHNLYETLGKTLYEGIQSGRLNPKALQSFSANIGIDLGRNYGLNINYSGRKQDLKVKLTKDF